VIQTSLVIRPVGKTKVPVLLAWTSNNTCCIDCLRQKMRGGVVSWKMPAPQIKQAALESGFGC
jgi:hypothetical protein